MKVDVDRDALVAALASVVPAASRTTYNSSAVMGCRFDAEGDTLRLTCTDIDKIASTVLAAEVKEPGAGIIPALLLNSLVAKTRGDRAEIVVDDGVAAVSIGAFETELACYALDNWPRIDSAGETTMVLSKDDASLVSRVAFAASGKDSARPMLCGLNFASHEVSSTDGYRAAVVTLNAQVPEMLPTAADVVAAIKAIGAGSVAVGGDGNWATFASEDGSLTWRIRCLAGAFPKLDTFFAVDRPHTLTIGTEDLIGAIGLVGPLIDAGETRPVSLDYADEQLTVSAATADRGTARATIPASGSVPGLMKYDGRYLLDAVQAVSGDEVSIQIADQSKPSAITSGALRQILMPIRPRLKP